MSIKEAQKKTIVGVFDTIWVAKFPTDYYPTALFFRGIDAEGEFSIRVEYVQTDSQKVLAEATANIHVQDRNKATELAIPLPPIHILVRVNTNSGCL